MKMALEHFKHKQSDAMRDFYTAHPELSIDAMVKATCKAADICIITFRKWRKQFVLNGKFKRCDSGLAQFGWLLVNNDKKNGTDTLAKITERAVGCGRARVDQRLFVE